MDERLEEQSKLLKSINQQKEAEEDESRQRQREISRKISRRPIPFKF